MKDWRNKYQVLFITVLSFWVLIFPTFGLSCSLGYLPQSSPANLIPEDLLTHVPDGWEE